MVDNKLNVCGRIKNWNLKLIGNSGSKIRIAVSGLKSYMIDIFVKEKGITVLNDETLQNIFLGFKEKDVLVSWGYSNDKLFLFFHSPSDRKTYKISPDNFFYYPCDKDLIYINYNSFLIKTDNSYELNDNNDLTEVEKDFLNRFIYKELLKNEK